VPCASPFRGACCPNENRARSYISRVKCQRCGGCRHQKMENKGARDPQTPQGVIPPAFTPVHRRHPPCPEKLQAGAGRSRPKDTKEYITIRRTRVFVYPGLPVTSSPSPRPLEVPGVAYRIARISRTAARRKLYQNIAKHSPTHRDYLISQSRLHPGGFASFCSADGWSIGGQLNSAIHPLSRARSVLAK
jgi:hypothetical protein